MMEIEQQESDNSTMWAVTEKSDIIQFTKPPIVNARMVSKPAEAKFTDMIESTTGTFLDIFQNIGKELTLNNPKLNSSRYWHDDVDNTHNFIQVVVKCTRDHLLQPGMSQRDSTAHLVQSSACRQNNCGHQETTATE